MTLLIWPAIQLSAVDSGQLCASWQASGATKPAFGRLPVRTSEARAPIGLSSCWHCWRSPLK